MSRPYFETKVVKVKKEKPLKTNWRIDLKDPLNPYCECPKCGATLTCKDNEKKGNWVNGENLDKIKFPCFCRFDSNKGIFGSDSGQCVKGIGKIDKTWEEGQDQYQISWADRQVKGLSVICTTPSLKRLFEIYQPKILPAKLILFEEEK